MLTLHIYIYIYIYIYHHSVSFFKYKYKFFTFVKIITQEENFHLMTKISYLYFEKVTLADLLKTDTIQNA